MNWIDFYNTWTPLFIPNFFRVENLFLFEIIPELEIRLSTDFFANLFEVDSSLDFFDTATSLFRFSENGDLNVMSLDFAMSLFRFSANGDLNVMLLDVAVSLTSEFSSSESSSTGSFRTDS